MRTPSRALIAKVSGRGMLSNQGRGLSPLAGRREAGVRHQSPHPVPAGALIDVEKKLAMAVIIADPECLSVTITQDVLLNRNAVVFKVRRPERRDGALAAPPLALAQ